MEATSSTKQVCGSIWQFVFYLSEVSQILETRRCPSMPSITDGHGVIDKFTELLNTAISKPEIAIFNKLASQN
jgi:hypothetical protein